MNKRNATLTHEELKAETYVRTAIKFDLGQVVMTQGISCLLSHNIGANLQLYLMRHKNGDWGTVCIDDKMVNDEATRTGERLLSSYPFCGETLWIITEADRSVTTVLLPSEY
ncbi:type I restriction endonuclease subunit M [Vibrio mimicus]|uniref:type I restriction endonuclease subunit M n=1 Tax=Vibrio mimicus TaxID=674 RepID=UPI002F953FD4